MKLWEVTEPFSIFYHFAFPLTVHEFYLLYTLVSSWSCQFCLFQWFWLVHSDRSHGFNLCPMMVRSVLWCYLSSLSSSPNYLLKLFPISKTKNFLCFERFFLYVLATSSLMDISFEIFSSKVLVAVKSKWYFKIPDEAQCLCYLLYLLYSIYNDLFVNIRLWRFFSSNILNILCVKFRSMIYFELNLNKLWIISWS